MRPGGGQGRIRFPRIGVPDLVSVSATCHLLPPLSVSVTVTPRLSPSFLPHSQPLTSLSTSPPVAPPRPMLSTGVSASREVSARGARSGRSCRRGRACAFRRGSWHPRGRATARVPTRGSRGFWSHQRTCNDNFAHKHALVPVLTRDRRGRSGHSGTRVPKGSRVPNPLAGHTWARRRKRGSGRHPRLRATPGKSRPGMEARSFQNWAERRVG